MRRGASSAGDPFPNNIIPADRIHPVGRNIASIYPLPNNGSGTSNNYISTPDREITDHAYSGRVDHRFTDNDSVFVRFNYGKFSLDAPQGQANCCLPTPADAAARFDLGPFVAGIQNTRLTTHGAAFNYSKVLTPTFVNELRIGYAKTNPFTTQSDYGLNSATSLGIQGINVNEITTGLPNIDIANFTGISGGPAFLPGQPEPVALPDRKRSGLDQGAPPDEVRLQARRSRTLADDPRQHAEQHRLRHQLRQQPGDQHRRHRPGRGACSATSTAPPADSCSKCPTSACVEQAAFVQDDFKVNSRSDRQCRACATRSSIAPTEERRPDGQLRLRDATSSSTPARTAPPGAPTRRRATTTSRRASASPTG